MTIWIMELNLGISQLKLKLWNWWQGSEEGQLEVRVQAVSERGGGSVQGVASKCCKRRGIEGRLECGKGVREGAGKGQE